MLLQFTNPETPGYVGFANLPNQVHRKSLKRGFEFTLMVAGKCKITYKSVLKICKLWQKITVIAFQRFFKDGKSLLLQNL